LWVLQIAYAAKFSRFHGAKKGEKYEKRAEKRQNIKNKGRKTKDQEKIVG
jgi:hypothetical protein